MGNDYNKDLMEGIAENSGGRYYFIEERGQSVAIFQEELSLIQNSVAKNIKLNIPTSGDYKVYGYESEFTNDLLSIKQEDFYSEEQRQVVVQFTLDPTLSKQSMDFLLPILKTQ